MPKITLDVENYYLIRCTKTRPTGEKDVSYFETIGMWNRSPLHSTLMSYEAAEGHLRLVDASKPALGWADGSTALYDIVPLYTEILHTPNATRIKVQPKPRPKR